MNILSLQQRAIGCMLGAAYGDSMGAPVEFMRREQIEKAFADKNLADPPLGFLSTGPGSITDDTQQSLAVARGLLDASPIKFNDSSLSVKVWHQLKKWHQTQLTDPFECRSPGKTSTSALSGEIPGCMRQRLNDSNSCGAVVRAHPIGLAFTGHMNAALVAGCEIGVLTHGHPDGFAPAGALAAIVAMTMSGHPLDVAITFTLMFLELHCPTAENSALWLKRALFADVQTTEIDFGLNARGWNGDEALAMGVLAARRHPTSLPLACKFAAVHDGDSNSTASIAGALVGSMIGPDTIPDPWAYELEHADELRSLAIDLAKLSGAE